MDTLIPAKAQVIKFVKDTKLGGEYSFEIEGTEADARKYIHNMRVHLSRLRIMVRGYGKTVLPFKMKLVSIERVNGTDTKSAIPLFQRPPIRQKVTLQKSDYDSELHAKFAEVLDGLSV